MTSFGKSSTSYLTKAKQWLMQFLYVQLFVTLLALPILVSWGLPISVMTLLGNLIFTPILTAFLSVSALLFFTELVHVPNMFLIHLLEWITTLWYWLTSFGSPHWLFGFAKPPTIVLILIPIGALAIVQLKHLKQVQRMFLLALLLCISIIALIIMKPSQVQTKLAFGKGEVSIVFHNGKMFLIDPGYLGQSPSVQSWIEYTLLPEMLKQCGTQTIDHCIALRPSKRTFQALTTLCQLTQVKKIYMPLWHASVDKKWWYQFFTFKRSLQEQNGKLIRLHATDVTIVEDDVHIIIHPMNKIIKTSNISYDAYAIEGTLGGEKMNKVYSLHFK